MTTPQGLRQAHDWSGPTSRCIHCGDKDPRGEFAEFCDPSLLDEPTPAETPRPSEANKDGVHVTHCCHEHGCKYGNEDCPVETGRLKQEFPCEQCGIDAELAGPRPSEGAAGGMTREEVIASLDADIRNALAEADNADDGYKRGQCEEAAERGRLFRATVEALYVNADVLQRQFDTALALVDQANELTKQNIARAEQAEAANVALRAQVAEGKGQWDRVAASIGANGDDVDDVLAKAVALRGERDALRQAIVEVANFAHDNSTGPEVPDTLWEVKQRLAEALRARLSESPIRSETKPGLLSASQEEAKPRGRAVGGAVAELIAADRAYNEAQDAATKNPGRTERMLLELANHRRRDALAALTNPQPDEPKALLEEVLGNEGAISAQGGSNG